MAERGSGELGDGVSEIRMKTAPLICLPHTLVQTLLGGPRTHTFL